jgi:hypothetical protein
MKSPLVARLTTSSRLRSMRVLLCLLHRYEALVSPESRASVRFRGQHSRAGTGHRCTAGSGHQGCQCRQSSRGRRMRHRTRPYGIKRRSFTPAA